MRFFLLIMICFWTNSALAADFDKQLQVVSIKSFVNYSKLSLISEEKVKGVQERPVEVYLPNAAPKIGMAIGIGEYINLSYSKSPREWQESTDRGTSKVIDYRLNLTPQKYIVELNYQKYTGFYLSSLYKNSLKTMGDSLWNTYPVDQKFPQMNIEVKSVGLLYNLQSDAIDFAVLINQKSGVLKTGWGTVIKFEIKEVEIAFDAQEDLYLQSLGILPGLSGVWVSDDWYIGAVGLAGLQRQKKINHSQGTSESKNGVSFDLKGVLGMKQKANIWGINGAKAISSFQERGDLLTLSSSSVEMFYQYRF